MSENTVVTPKTDKEMSEIYKSITQQLNGLSAAEAKTMIRKIEFGIYNQSIVSFSPDYIDPYYDAAPHQ